MPSRRVSILVLALLFLSLAGETAYLYWLEHQPKQQPCDPIIARVAHETGVDPFLIRALIWRESRFDPNTHGTAADERGLMQVTPQVGEMWAKTNKIASFSDDQLYDPETNIRVGTWYLGRSLKRWVQTDDPVTFALAEYNAGRSNALKWVDPERPLDHAAFLDRITFPSTKKYVTDIQRMRTDYRKAFADNPIYREYTADDSSMTASP